MPSKPISLITIAGSSLLCFSVFAQAQKQAPSEGPFDSVMVYTAQGVNHNLLGIPKAVFGGNVRWEPSYLNALSLGKSLGTLGANYALFNNSPWNDVTQGYELVVAKHHGLQSHVEAGLAYTIRSTDLELGPVAVNTAFGLGLSHAFGRPSYEDGPKDNPDKRYRTQLLLLLDFEWKLRSYDRLRLVTRIHHRSGAYGLIAPRNVGSNFLAIGLRYAF